MFYLFVEEKVKKIKEQIIEIIFLILQKLSFLIQKLLMNCLC